MIQCLCVSHDVAVLSRLPCFSFIFYFIFCLFVFSSFQIPPHKPFEKNYSAKKFACISIILWCWLFWYTYLFAGLVSHCVFLFSLSFIDFLSLFSPPIDSMIHYHVPQIYNDTLLLLNLMIRSCFLIISYRIT